MTAHPYDVLPLADGGRLILTPCPGTKGAGLAESLAQLRRAGADAVLSMTPREELAKLEVAGLPEAVDAAGMRWFHFPIEDDAAPGPAFEQAWAANRDAVKALVSQRGSVVIHCRGGSGRTGLMAARSGGEGGIRTLDRLLTYTHFPGVLLKPLGHLSGSSRDRLACSDGFARLADSLSALA
jgi:protein tyrosine phosphatase (PTP) superfamily phosphohydrolase (DUF442 family)